MHLRHSYRNLLPSPSKASHFRFQISALIVSSKISVGQFPCHIQFHKWFTFRWLVQLLVILNVCICVCAHYVRIFRRYYTNIFTKAIQAQKQQTFYCCCCLQTTCENCIYLSRKLFCNVNLMFSNFQQMNRFKYTLSSQCWTILSMKFEFCGNRFVKWNEMKTNQLFVFCVSYTQI